LNDRCLIVRESSSGGFGKVFSSQDQQLHNRSVMVKIQLDRAIDDPWFEKRFTEELRAGAHRPTPRPAPSAPLPAAIVVGGGDFIFRDAARFRTAKARTPEAGGIVEDFTLIHRLTMRWRRARIVRARTANGSVAGTREPGRKTPTIPLLWGRNRIVRKRCSVQ